MEQHPVPQPISSYEFRLIGDMTVKQFGKLSAGLIAALIVYGINPPIAFLKWTLIFLFSGLGLAVAFVPFQGRPIDIWIVAFFKRIYSPTIFLWENKNNKIELPKSIKEQKVENIMPTIQNTTITTNMPSLAQPIVNPPPIVPDKKPIEASPLQPTIEPSQNKIEAKFTPNIIVPAVPSFPNIIVGYIRSKEGKLVDSAILEIRDTTGIPVRALKTNKLGQFQIVTPLPNGNYEIEVEKEDFVFDIIKISLLGKIIPPIEIVAK